MARPLTAVHTRTRHSDGPSDVPGNDVGDIVVGWLVRVVASVAVVGVLLFDAVSIAAAKMSVTDQASMAARAASDDWAIHHSQQSAFDAAWAAATEANPTNTVDTRSFQVAQNGTVRLTVHRTAPTLVLRLVGPAHHWADVVGEGVGRTGT
jgi:hypothetical protein